jgi:hypothetical protein
MRNQSDVRVFFMMIKELKKMKNIEKNKFELLWKSLRFIAWGFHRELLTFYTM